MGSLGWAPFAGILGMRREGHVPPDDSASAGQSLQGGLGCGLRRKPLGLEMEELLLHLLRLFRLRVGERCCRPLPGVLRRDDQPPLRHTVMAPLHPLISDGLIQGLPLAPGPGLRDDLLRNGQGLGNPGNKGEPGQVRRIRFGV